MTDAGLKVLMEPVARLLLGPPNPKQSKGHKLRWGNNGSLSVDVRKGVWHDYENNTGGGVLDLITRQTGLTGAERFQWLEEHGFANGEVREPRAKARIVETYNYTDESGTLLSQVVRYEPKTFRQRRPLPGGGYEWNLKGARHVPYRLPEVLERLAEDRMVMLVEGEKDADRLWSIGVPATTNAMGAGKWRDELSEHFAGAHVAIIPDHDAPGMAHAQMVAAALSPIAATVKVVDLVTVWPAIPDKGDVSDWLDHGGTAEALHALIEDSPVWAPGEADDGAQPQRFALTRFADIRVSTARNYLIKGMLPRSGLAVVWGPPKCGKSFVAFDMAMHIAIGRDYRSRRVQRGIVVYCALEGGGGFPARVEAWRQHKLGDTEPREVLFNLLAVSLDLIAECSALVAAIRAQVTQPAVVFIDTLNRALVGDENSSADMGKLVKAAGAIIAAFDCLVVLVHHCGVAGTRPRGHTSLIGADDAQIAVVRDKDDVITVTTEHMKDAESGPPFACRLERVELGRDDDGDPMTSCIVMPQALPEAAQGPALTGNDKLAYDTLLAGGMTGGEVSERAGQWPKSLAGWRSRFHEAHTSDKRDTKKRLFNRSSLELQNLGIITVSGDDVWLAGQAGQGGTT
jgi:hypothetical protein